ncbi:hypothetical protein VIGAN_04221200, partial [Vigna angularis var. angularis]
GKSANTTQPHITVHDVSDVRNFTSDAQKSLYIKRFYYRSGKKLWSAVLTLLLFNLALFFAQFERYHTRFLNPMS